MISLALVALLAVASASASVDEIAAQVGQVSHAKTLAQIETYLAEHPGADDAGRAWLLAAQLERTDGHPERTRALLERVPPESPWAADAALALADLELWEWHFDQAIVRYQAVAGTHTGRWQYQGQLGVELSRAAQRRLWLVLTVGLLLLLLAAWRIFKARPSSLWPLPEEAKIGLPVCLAMRTCS